MKPTEIKRFTHAGFTCLILKVPRMGHLCGYVMVEDGHPWHGLGYDQIEERFDVNVHGGLTFAAKVDGKWQVGFDCAHAGDVMPEIMHSRYEGSSHKDAAYVTGQCKSLAEQAASATAEKSDESHT